MGINAEYMGTKPKTNYQDQYLNRYYQTKQKFPSSSITKLL